MGKYNGAFRLKIQAHDEIVFMAKDVIVAQAVEDVANIMVIPLEINGRTMTIPSTKEIGKSWAEVKG